MKKLLAGVLVGALTLISTVNVSAFTESCSGQWGGDSGVNYNYISDGTLIVKGTNGTESITVKHDTATDINDADFKNVIIDNVENVGVGTDYIFNHYYTTNLTSFYVNATNVGKLADLRRYCEVEFGEDVQSIGSQALGSGNFETDVPIKITIPSSVTSLADDWITLWRADITIVCEYGSAAYNWAVDKQDNGRVDVNIELYDYSAYSNVTIDNTQKYTIVVPETITFNWSNLGWECDTFLGVIGTVPNGASLKIKTDESFTILGETISSVETVNVSTEDSNTVNSNTFLVTTLDKDALDNATDDIEVNDATETGYRIDYTCVTDSVKLMKQSYSGVMKFMVTE